MQVASWSGLALVLAGAALALPLSGRGAGRGAATPLVLNEDDSHFFGSRSAERMNLEGLHALVDQCADTAVSHLFLCPNAMKASHRSQARDAIWELEDGQKPPADDFAKKWCANARLLNERGMDPYAIWIARCREKQVSPWLSMRMNDVHNVDDADLSLFSGVARAVRHQCPPDALRAGYNDVHIKQAAGGPGQKIVWVELRVVPRL